MKQHWKELWGAILLGMILPGIILNLSKTVLEGNAKELLIVETVSHTDTAEKIVTPVFVRFPGGKIMQMDMDAYLTGVVLGEMPAEFEVEALKAQAVAARTYTAKAIQTSGKHGDGTVCTDPGCCQAYLSEESYLSKGGTAENLERVRRAVLDTSGYVLTYAGELIEATYFSCSGGSTEDAVDVWGTDYPYLQSVASPGEEGSVHYRDTICFTAADFQKKIGCQLTGNPESWFELESCTEGGGISSMRICGEAYSGTQLRQLLGLPSTAMTISAKGDTITIVTRGYGHRVGMSQYGADAMAVTGKNFIQILTHYYPGTQLEVLS